MWMNAWMGHIHIQEVCAEPALIMAGSCDRFIAIRPERSHHWRENTYTHGMTSCQPKVSAGMGLIEVRRVNLYRPFDEGLWEVSITETRGASNSLLENSLFQPEFLFPFAEKELFNMASNHSCPIDNGAILNHL